MKLRAWILASRPATLTAAFTPVAVGTACAFAVGKLAWGPACLALAGAFCIQIGTNLANDVFDFEKGADTTERLGPVRAVQAGLLSAREVRGGMVVAFGLATAAGMALAWIAGWPVVAIGVASILSGIAYTGGPYPLGYHGLGDLFVVVFFGFVAVCGTAFVQAGAIPTLALWAAVPVGALATAVLVVNNVRDREQDAAVGKRTLAVRLGPTGARVEFALLVATAELIPVALVAVEPVAPWVLLPLLTVPWAALLVRRIWRDQGRALNGLLARTAQLLLVHGCLLAVGLTLSRPGS
ncbi:MAG TPA: 1,4-dihydroxy-2-naphthoate polyprenyltransferase [Solirubrobacteraceae bacterium]|nr:1,4-dihydroxy-2-naphthoate polyprenyltransferase [Solirubrobacteraceae bacterium]